MIKSLAKFFRALIVITPYPLSFDEWLMFSATYTVSEDYLALFVFAAALHVLEVLQPRLEIGGLKENLQTCAFHVYEKAVGYK